LNWALDVAFNEDRMRQRDRNGGENLALLNRLAVSLLRQDKTVKAGVKCKRKTAGWDDNYLFHLWFDAEQPKCTRRYGEPQPAKAETSTNPTPQTGPCVASWLLVASAPASSPS
jgi:hypothetical protein